MYNKKSKILLFVICGLIITMSIGFALLQQELTITGTSSIDSNWNIRITNIRVKNVVSAYGSGTNKSEDISGSNGCTTKTAPCNSTTANFEAKLITPGDSITYEVTVTNSGTLDGVVQSISLLPETGANDAIQVTKSGLAVGDTISHTSPNNTNTIDVTITYNPNTTEQPSSTTTNITLTINYQQNLGQQQSGKQNTPMKLHEMPRIRMTKSAPVVAHKYFVDYSITLDSAVGMNFIIDFENTEYANRNLTDGSAVVEFSWGNKWISDNNYSNNETYTYTDDALTEVIINNHKYYMATCGVAPKEIGDTITAVLKVDNATIATDTNSVKDYAYTILDNPSIMELSSTNQEKAVSLIKALLTYGSAAQKQFEYHDDNLADAQLTDVHYNTVNPTSMSEDLIEYNSNYPAAGYNLTNTPLQFLGYTMTLNSNTVLNLVFQNKGTAENYNFTISPNNVSVYRYPEGNYYRFDINDIKITQLLDDITITISSGNGSDSITVNPGTYMYKVLQTTNDTVKTTFKNLYNYYLKAIAYFE